MYFTQEDYKKIENWLHRNSVKDTEFQEALPFTGKEIVTVVQDGHNRKVNIQEFINQLYKHGVEDFLNVTNTYKANNITLKEAIRLIPAEARKEGQVITFLNTDGNWEIYQFIGKLNQWNNPTLWNNPFDWEKLIVDSILPDEEDLTKSAPDAKGNSYLALKDRKYEPDKYSGLGRKILRRRVVEIEDPIYGTQDKNLLLQADFDEENTVYVVRYDFTLNGQDITLPDNSYIEYEGGSTSDGNIIDRAGGLNRVVLKKNIVNSKNILTQEMVSKSNTIYEIRYDFDLNDKEITIPEGCVLDFQGGSLSNGEIVGNNTAIQSGSIQIFGLDVELNGNWNIDKFNVKWFGAKGDKINDDTICIQKAASFKFPLYIPIGEYLISDTCQIYNDIFCYGEFIFIKTEFDAPIIELMPHEYPKHSIARGIKINISNYEYGTSNYGGYGIVIHNCWTLENCDVTSCKYGIVAKSWVINIQNCNAKYNEINLIVTGGNKGENEECNNVYITGGSFDSPRSEFSALIGESPLSGYGNWDVDGKNIRIEECAFDGGTVQISRVVAVCVTSCYFENVQNGSALTLYDKNSYGANYIFVSNHFNKCRYGLTCYKERLSNVSATYRTPGVVFTDNFMLKITHSFVYIPSPCVKLVAKHNINILEDKVGDISNPFCKYYIGLPWDSPKSMWDYSNLYLDILNIDDYDGRYKQKDRVNIGNTYSYVSSPCFTRTKIKKSSGLYDSATGKISLLSKDDIIGFYPGDYITWNKEAGPSGNVTNAYIRSIDYDKGIILVSVDNTDIQPSTIEFQTVSTEFKTIVEVVPFGGNVVGQFMFNEELNKPIWWNGTKWVDATGADV